VRAQAHRLSLTPQSARFFSVAPPRAEGDQTGCGANGFPAPVPAQGNGARKARRAATDR